jgi:hypothetical protein
VVCAPFFPVLQTRRDFKRLDRVVPSCRAADLPSHHTVTNQKTWYFLSTQKIPMRQNYMTRCKSSRFLSRERDWGDPDLD